MIRYSPLFCVVCVGIATHVSAGETTPTFPNDVAKIIHERCTSCHRPDSLAPFSLITYGDVKQRTAVVSLSVLILSVPTTRAAEPNFAWKPTDIDGKVHEPFGDQSSLGLALVFISTDCPIANSYQPLLRRLASEYRRDGMRIFMIHPSLTVSIAEARNHASEFGITVPVVIDTDQSIARRVGATVTPQAFVFARNQKTPVYDGRIDNPYAGYGKKRKVATTHEFADALEAVVAGREVSVEKITPAGCFISYAEASN